MLAPEIVQRQRISSDEAFIRIKSALESREAFSYVRMNDGEAVILGAFGDVHQGAVRKIIRHWWAKEILPDGEIEEIRQTLLDAAADADILAFYDEFDKKPERYQACGKMLRKYAKLHSDQSYLEVNCHYEWQAQDRYVDLFENVDRIAYISCYDLTDALSRKFGFDEVRRVSIPGHARYTEGGPHWPERFRELCVDLQSVEKGSVWLVGAGVLGKHYCRLIKKAGGVALDLGSVFDFWAENTGRAAVRKGASRLGL